MYLAHFGLDHAPFRITPDTRVFYPGAERGNVLEALTWCIDNGEGMVKVVGEVGAGKTMLCRKLATRLPEHVDRVYLVNPDLRAADVVPAIAFELGLNVDPTQPLVAQHRLYEALVERHGAGRQVVVFIEEAQRMPAESLEAVRLLSNLETDDAKLLQIVMFGQPELDQKLAAPEIRQLRERITHGFDLGPLSHAEAARYLDFRLRGAGYRGPDLFGKRTARMLNRRARGLIRRLNVLADKTLLAAYAEGKHTVTPRHVRRAARDAEAAPMRRGRAGLAWGVGTAAVSLALALGLVSWLALAPSAERTTAEARRIAPIAAQGQ